MRVSIVNLHADEVGNPQLPKKFLAQKKHRARMRLVATMAALFALAVALVVVSKKSARSTSTIPEKSIAVLPFDDLSEEKGGAHIAEGVQNEILTDLAKVADLKVISRTSVMQYSNSAQRNLREIARVLGVAHVLGGTVQRANSRIRVSAQLTDARNDTQLWADRFDRDVADVFELESELAEKIVAQLKTKLSPQEKAAIEERPTNDLVAYDLYVRAKTLSENAQLSAPLNESLFEAVRLLEQAIQRDPKFALAYYQLGHAHDLIYFVGADHTPERLAMADAAIQSLARLRPNSGEAHLALAKHLYWGYLNYDRAREELNVARRSLPNDPLPFLLTGYIDRRQGRWAESTKNLERAVELDPRNPTVLQQMASSYECLRRYADAAATLDRAIVLAPKDAATRASRAQIELVWHADPRPLSSTIRTILAEDSREAENIAEFWLQASLCERDFDGALRALAALPIAGCHRETIPFPRTWCEGIVAQMRGDKVAARTAFTSARNETAKLVREQPAYAEALCALGMADAVLGHKEDAIREGRRAVELLPVTKDSIVGPLLVQNLALIYAWTGEKDLALEQLASAASIPGYLSYGELRLHPSFDALRDDPRFDKIVASLAPK